MKTTIKVSEISHEELVNLFSGALYGDNTFSVEYTKDKALLKKIKDNAKKSGRDCYEDILAEILLQGGSIFVIDNESSSTNKKHVDVNGNKKHTIVRNGEDWYNGKPLYATKYEITLQDVLDAFAKEYKLAVELCDEGGDFYTAWNLLQTAVFGKIIYG